MVLKTNLDENSYTVDYTPENRRVKMGNYPVWWEDTITIYNRYEDPLTRIVQWFRHTITNCFWKDTGNKITVGDTVLETNDIICRIPQNEAFLPAYEWVNKPNDKKADFFTIGKNDIIVKGAVEDIIDEHTSGHRATDLIAKYKELQGCLEVQRVGINTGTGKCNPHYFVKGI